MEKAPQPRRGSLPIPKRDRLDRRIKKSREQEKMVAEVLGGRTTKCSRKGDVELDATITDLVGILLECKHTGNKQITVKASYLEKITKQAQDKERSPAFCFSLNVCGAEDTWVAFPLSVAKEIFEKFGYTV
jgi:hypothetical protein